jgi:hypothetical protein
VIDPADEKGQYFRPNRSMLKLNRHAVSSTAVNASVDNDVNNVEAKGAHLIDLASNKGQYSDQMIELKTKPIEKLNCCVICSIAAANVIDVINSDNYSNNNSNNNNNNNNGCERKG